jgi:glycosyltransferase involved in cell wall biosynthesis
MKIVFFNTYNQSFLSGFFLDLCDELSLRGHEVYLICLKQSNKEIKRPSGVSVLIYKRQSKFKNYLKIFRLIKLHKPEIIVSNFSYVNPSVLSSWILGVKNNIIWFHTLKSQMNFTFKQIAVKSQFMKMASAIITNSEELKQEVISEYKQKREKVIFLPFTTSIHEIMGASIDFQRKTDNFYLGCPGRIDKEKNQSLILELLYKLNDDRFIAVFAGRNDINLLQKHTYYERFSEQIIFLGNLSKEQMITFYIEMDVIILPSLSEAFGLVLIEALASGCNTLVSSRFGALDYIKEDVSTITFNPSDVEDLKNKLEAALVDKKSTQYFKELYINNFSMNEIIKQFLTLIEK